ncbi:MAG: D-alanyl-D-alanine carboxypeptidase [Rhodocyclaceae bacterium]|nr:D-alanyl-D-alanine carboxypeptidase [Rhodocyclaceae bacterium]MBP7080952.1 D-alanyl-D-alanine carboxypeptidase [Rhodocyclaceae bacterium]
MRILFVLFCVFVTSLYSAANAQAPVLPTLTARAWVLMDYQTGQILASQEADLKLEPASLTKVMTTYLVAAALKNKSLVPDQKVVISERAWRTYGSRSFLQVGSTSTVEDLLKGMVIQSGNDASVALAEAAAGSEEAFAERMNSEAKRLGLNDTHFLNSSGFFDNAEPRHYSTARDLAKLAAALVRDHPETHAIHAIKEYRSQGILQHNRNRLLWLDPSVDGLKTGHSSAAGYCLISTALRGSQRLIAVVLATPSDAARADDSIKLLNWGYLAFEPVKLFAKDQPVAEIAVFKGAAQSVKIGFKEDFSLSVPKGSASKVTQQLDQRPPLIAPVPAGTELATLTLSVDGKPWGSYPVVALNGVEEGNIFRRFWDWLRLLFL